MSGLVSSAISSVMDVDGGLKAPDPRRRIEGEGKQLGEEGQKTLGHA